MYIMLNNVGIAIGVCFWGCNYTIYYIVLLLRWLFGIQSRESVLLDHTVGCCRYAYILLVISVLVVD